MKPRLNLPVMLLGAAAGAYMIGGCQVTTSVEWEVRCLGPDGWITHITNKTPPVRSKIRIFKIGETYYTTCTFRQVK